MQHCMIIPETDTMLCVLYLMSFLAGEVVASFWST